MPPVIMWFRRDLRLSDHPALHRAISLAGPDGVVPLFVVDDEFLAPSGPTRATFLAGCLDDLAAQMGSALVLRAGDPRRVVPELAQEVGARAVVITAEFGPAGRRRDREVEEALARDGVALHRVSSPYAVDPGTIKGDGGSPLRVFSAFHRRWTQILAAEPLPKPEVRWIDAPSTVSSAALPHGAGTARPPLFADLPDGPPTTIWPTGEASALQRLAAFVDDRIASYDERRDVFAEDATSRLSPYLHFGCIHPRTALAAVFNDAAPAVRFRAELCWREFYADVLFHHPSSVREPLQPWMGRLRVDQGDEADDRFRTWARGQTGIPLVDAAMRQLLDEGWMHNRARMVAASFLVKHLHVDWRHGARWFMWRLVDGDLASNQHGWQWTAGTGTDAAPYHRIFSPLAQAERFDPEGTYIRRYVPELRAMPAPQIFQPGGGVTLLEQADYPAPMVDIKAERAEALLRFAEVRAQREEATGTR